MRDIGSHAPHLKAMRSPKALGSRRSGRAGEPPEGVGKPCRCPATPAAFLLPARWPDRSPARSLWVIINAPWYKTKGCLSRKTVLTMVFKLCQSAGKKWRRLDGAHHLAEIIRGVKF